MSTAAPTSAFLAVLNADDQNHASAKEAWDKMVSHEETLLCTNYILVETFALVQHRLGMEAARTLHDDILPLVSVEWIDAQSHYSSVIAKLVAGRRRLSLVDCASFETMRRLGLSTAFAFDRDFKGQGFEIIP